MTKELNTMFFWKGHDRVARNQMLQDYGLGGLRMVDVRAYIDALKITWLRRLYKANQSSDWSTLCNHIFGITRLLLLEGGSAKCVGTQRIYNNFWLDVFKSWSNFTRVHLPTTTVEVLKSTLWFNDKIKVGGKCIYYKHWESKGVKFICDLIDENGDFLPLEDFKNTFSVHTNFLEYSGVLRAIKSSFKDILIEHSHLNFPFLPFNLEVLLKDKKGSQRIYHVLVLSKQVKRKFIDKWNVKLNTNLDSSKWSLIFNIPYSCTVDTKLRWFQFRLIHRILGTNSFLFKINKTDTNLCTFCKKEEETIFHLFCSCTHTISFWSSVFSWIKEQTNFSLAMDNEVFLFGNTKNSNVVNLILLICRFHVYTMKMIGKRPSLLVLKREVKKYYSMEKFMFFTNGVNFKFYQKWDSFLILGQG